MKEFDYKKLIELGFCWGNHQVKYKTSIKSAAHYLISSGSYSQEMVKEVKKEMIKFLNTAPNVRKLKLPELITWCGCEPQCSKFREMRSNLLREITNEPPSTLHVLGH